MHASVLKLARSIREARREVDVHRALTVTRVYRETEGQPPILRRAKALAEVLRTMPIYINDGEAIVGNQAFMPKAGHLFPEYAHDWILAQLDTLSTRPGDRFHISEEDKARLREALPYWDGRSLRDRWLAILPAETLAAMRCGVVANENYTMSGPGHLVPDYPKLLRLGFRGIRREIDERTSRVSPGDPDRKNKLDFYRAASMVCDAAVAYAHRYARLAEEMADRTPNVDRRAQLRGVARICSHVPEHPARTFWDALQSIWFVQVIIQIESNGLSIAPGRFDQYMYPYYRDDIAAGRLTRDQAKDLLGCFYCKLAEINKVYSNEGARLLAGPSQGQCLTLAGEVEGGGDGTNELTYLCLEADTEVRMAQPDLALRINEDTPEPLLHLAAANIRTGLAKPKIFGDRLVTRSQVLAGVPDEDARDWAALGCSEPAIPGKTNAWGNSGQVCLAKCLELALNGGRCRLTSQQMGPSTGDPRTFASFEEVLAAYRTQLAYFVGHLVASNNTLDRLHAAVCPVPFVSLFISDCTKRGVEMNAGGARYNFTSPVGVGLITVADSLAAIKKLVFEDGALTMSQLVDALDRNFEGQESLRQTLLNRAPKFGNDDDYVDSIANDLLNIWADLVEGHTNPRGGRWVPGLYSMTASVGFGERCGATPDGRRAGGPLNDNVSPSHGREMRGPTAVARSVGKLDMVRIPHGAILNMRLSPAVLQGEKGLEDLAAFVRAFVALGGWHDQFNVISTETLREAQKHPERYRDLLVRVSGYSAHFVELSREVQEDIMARTEHM